jgi:hypothetical protein
MIRHRGLSERTPCDKNNIVTLFEIRMETPYGLAKPALHLVAPDRLPHPLADSEPVAIVLESVGRDAQYQEPVRHGSTAPSDALEITGAAEPQPPRNHRTP